MQYTTESPCPVTYQRVERSGGRGPGYAVRVGPVGVLVTEDDKTAVNDAVTLVSRTLDAIDVPYAVTELRSK